MEYLGVPPIDILLKSTRRKLFFDADNLPKVITNSKGKRRQPGSKEFKDTLRNCDERFIRLLNACFV